MRKTYEPFGEEFRNCLTAWAIEAVMHQAEYLCCGVVVAVAAAAVAVVAVVAAGLEVAVAVF